MQDALTAIGRDVNDVGIDDVIGAQPEGECGACQLAGGCRRERENRETGLVVDGAKIVPRFDRYAVHLGQGAPGQVGQKLGGKFGHRSGRLACGREERKRNRRAAWQFQAGLRKIDW